MGTTTFSDPVRSENGFQMISKNATTGTITVTSGNKMDTEATTGCWYRNDATYITQVNRLKSDVSTNVNIVETKILIDLMVCVQLRLMTSLVKMVMVLLTLVESLLLIKE